MCHAGEGGLGRCAALGLVLHVQSEECLWPSEGFSMSCHVCEVCAVGTEAGFNTGETQTLVTRKPVWNEQAGLRIEEAG